MANFSAGKKVSTGLRKDEADSRDGMRRERMVKLRLVYRPKDSPPRYKADAPIFEKSDLSTVYFPTRTLPFSIVYHIVVFCVVFYLQVTNFAADNARLLEKTVENSRDDLEVVMFLPILESGSPFEAPPAAKPKEQPKEPPKAPPKAPPKEPAEEPAAASSSSKKGLVYPGPQPILSNPPDPTNRIQTLLQPDIEDPEILAPPLSLPNIVQFADTSTAAKPDLDIGPIAPPPPPLLSPLDELKPREPRQRTLLDIQPAKVDEVELTMPPVEVAPPAESDAPKLVIPPMVVSDLEPPPPEPLPQEPAPEEAPSTAELRPDVTEESVREALAANASPAPEDPLRTGASPKIANRVEEAPLPQSSSFGVSGSDQKDLLALTPIPAPIQLPIQVPSGEARGSFAISPEPNLDTSETEPGNMAGVPSAEPGLDSPSTASDGAPASEGVVRNITFGGSGGSAENKDSINVEIASGLGGSAQGQGTGTGMGTGTSEGAGTGKGPFSGITIVGGSYDTGAAASPDPVVQASRPLQTSYGVTVISTENSGGGLPYVGVFSNEQVYTVYLDVREAESDPAPSWILEFALFADSSDPAGVSDDPAENQEGLILPFPITKKIPALPDDLVQNYLNELVIVYAVINVDGRAEQMSVKQSPDARLNKPLLNALSEWVFRPAQLYGKPVAIKALLGIPLWIPRQSTPGVLNLDIF